MHGLCDDSDAAHNNASVNVLLSLETVGLNVLKSSLDHGKNMYTLNCKKR